MHMTHIPTRSEREREGEGERPLEKQRKERKYQWRPIGYVHLPSMENLLLGLYVHLLNLDKRSRPLPSKVMNPLLCLQLHTFYPP